MFKRAVQILTLLSPLIFLATNQPCQAQDPGILDTVRVSTVSGTPGSQVILTVTGYNDEDLAGIQVPLKFSSSSVIIDSISFAGSRLSGASTLPVSIDNVTQKAAFGAVYFAGPLSAGDGLFARIFLTIKPSAVAETVAVDTFYEPPSALSFVNPDAIEWTPQFKPGRIIIQLFNPPPVWQKIANQSVLEGDSLKIMLKAKDPNGDPLTFVALNGPPGSRVIKLSDSTALFTWVPFFAGPYSSSGSPFKVTFVVTDGSNFVRQDVNIYVINKGVFALQIEGDTAYPGDSAVVSIGLSNSDDLIGFRLLVHYDQSVMKVRRVTRQNGRVKDWKVFSYQLDPNSVSGDILFQGQADFVITPQTIPLSGGAGPIIDIVFQVGRDCLFSGRSVPVYFVSREGIDNALIVPGGDTITQNEISFQDGDVNILQAKIGDINGNGIAYEISDAVLFSNYFIYGDSVFSSDPERRAAQIAATDINLDGYVLTVGDLTLMIRIIGGEPPPQCGVFSAAHLTATEGKR